MSRTQSDACFQIKGSNVTSIILELTEYPSPQFATQLTEKVSQAPALFQQSAIVISLEKLASTALFVNLNALIAECQQAGLQPMAFKGGDDSFGDTVKETGLPWLPSGSGRNQPLMVRSEPEKVVETVVETVVEERLVHRPSKVIDRPVRGGQQIYAEGADLIVLAQVSEGAEVLADGHIHIYAPLRGRALAGVKGDQTARIFCQQLEAELVSVAGTFKLSDDLRDSSWKQPAQIYIENDTLKVVPLAK